MLKRNFKFQIIFKSLVFQMIFFNLFYYLPLLLSLICTKVFRIYSPFRNLMNISSSFSPVLMSKNIIQRENVAVIFFFYIHLK